MQEIIQKIVSFLNYAGSWFDENIRGSGVVINFFRAILNLTIAILYFFIDIIRWLISKI